jgi:hypothetical protein
VVPLRELVHELLRRLARDGRQLLDGLHMKVFLTLPLVCSSGAHSSKRPDAFAAADHVTSTFDRAAVRERGSRRSATNVMLGCPKPRAVNVSRCDAVGKSGVSSRSGMGFAPRRRAKRLLCRARATADAVATRIGESLAQEREVAVGTSRAFSSCAVDVTTHREVRADEHAVDGIAVVSPSTACRAWPGPRRCAPRAARDPSRAPKRSRNPARSCSTHRLVAQHPRTEGLAAASTGLVGQRTEHQDHVQRLAGRERLLARFR